MSFLTAVGERYLIDKLKNGGEAQISQFVLAYVPDLVEESENREFVPEESMIVGVFDYTACGYVNENQLIYSLTMDSNVGDFDFNWVGLADKNGVFIIATHLATQQKRKNKGAVPGNTMTRSVLVEYSGLQNLAGVSVPAETWQLDLSDRFQGVDERERLSNLDIFGHESVLEDSFLVRQSGDHYEMASGIGYVGGIRIECSDAQLIHVESWPTSLWLDVSLQGDLSDMSSVMSLIVDDALLEDVIENDVVHYRTKIADILADGSLVDTRVVYENVAQHEAKADPHPQYKDYTDTALSTSKTYTDGETAATLASAKTYTDSETAATLSSAKSDATSKADTALASAKAYTDGLDAANVKLSGAQSVAGRKTFSTAPRSSVAPSNAADLARKDYVDDMGSATLSSAQTDATSKADTALASAKTHASNANNLTSGTVALDRLPTGSGNGLDADLLDGLESSRFVRSDVIPASMTGTLTINNSIDTKLTLQNGDDSWNYILFTRSDGSRAFESGVYNADNDVYYIRGKNTSSSGAKDLLTAHYTDGVVKVMGNEVWHAGNVGTGSGLDADKLDGQEGSYYRDASNLNAGTVADARLPSDLARTNTADQEFGDRTVFSGAQVFFGGGEHSLFNNDGLGNAGMKLGCNKNVMTVNGGAFELEAYVDTSSDLMGWHIAITDGGQTVGDTVSWSSYKLQGKSDGTLTWGGEKIVTQSSLEGRNLSIRYPNYTVGEVITNDTDEMMFLYITLDGNNAGQLDGVTLSQDGSTWYSVLKHTSNGSSSAMLMVPTGWYFSINYGYESLVEVSA